jgi:LPS-assembly lipoprotein
MTLIRCSLILVVIAALSACGFQLRGSDVPLRKTFSSIQLITDDKDEGLNNALDLVLRSSQIKRNADSANQLQILSSKTTRRTASYSSRAKSAEYELIKSVEFRFRRDDQDIIAPMTLEARRSYLYRETAAVGKAEEERLLRQEMDSDLAQRILLAIERAAIQYLASENAKDSAP